MSHDKPPWWKKEKKKFRHEFRTTEKEEEAIRDELEKSGKTLTQFVIDSIVKKDGAS